MKRFFCTFGVAMIASSAAIAETDFWVIPETTAQCIRDHATDYAKQGADPVVIIVEACPEVDMATALSQTATNTGTTTVGAGDSVVILSTQELECLAGLDLEPDANGLVHIPKSLRCD